MELGSTARYNSNEESEIQSSYSLSLMGMSRLTLMNEILIDMYCETLEHKLFPKNLYSDTEFVTTLKYPPRSQGTLQSDNCVLDFSEVLYQLFSIIRYIRHEKQCGSKMFQEIYSIKELSFINTEVQSRIASYLKDTS